MIEIKKTAECDSLKAKKAKDSAKSDATQSDAAKPNAVPSDVPRGSGGKPDASAAKPKIKNAVGSTAANGETNTSKPVVTKPTRDNATKAAAATPAKPKITKQEQVLTMLSKVGGTTIDEIMKATGWQQHSVRGFFAGTVRKKLGFELTSEKDDGSERRYAIKIEALAGR
jgi:Protein of unknown function (DUF3489)